MKKVLVLTYYFPPANTVAVFRAKSWAQHFKRCGIFPVFVTRHWSGDEKVWKDLMKDNSNKISHKVFDDYEVYKLPSSKLAILRLLGKSLMKISFISKAVYFLLHYFGFLSVDTDADKAFRPFLKEHLKDNKYDVILATSPPLNIIRLASYLGNKFGIPYIVDFRDLWNNDLLKQDYQPTGLRKFLEKRTEFWLNKWLNNAVLCTAVSEPIADVLGLVFSQERAVVQNGFDSEIFETLIKEDSQYFEITLSGTYYFQQDISLISDGLLQFLDGKNAAEVRVNFIGLESKQNVADLLKEKIPAEFSRWFDRLDMKDAMQMVKNSHVLLHSGWVGYRGIYTTKIFDYIASGNNILLAPGDRDVMENLVLETSTGKVATDINGFIEILNDWYNQWKETGTISYSANKTIEKYSRKAQAENMVSIIFSALERVKVSKSEIPKVLVLSYYFPPFTGVASWRPFSWANNFHLHGLKTTIITRVWKGDENSWNDIIKKNSSTGIYRSNESYNLFAVPSQGSPVLAWLEKYHLNGLLLSKLVHAIFLIRGRINPEVDAFLTFKKFLKVHLKRNNYDVIILTSPPPNIVELAPLIKRRSDAIIIVDFRDLWNNFLMTVDYRPDFKQRLFDVSNNIHHKKWLKDVDIITGIVPTFDEILQRVSKLKMHLFYNGYEKYLFDSIKKENSDLFRFVVVGTLYPQQDLSILLDGLKLFLKNKSENEVVIKFIGISALPEVEKKIRRELPGSFIETTPRVSKELAVYNTINAEVLFYAGWKGVRGMISTKTFDYLASGNKILIAPGDDDVLDEIIINSGAGVIANDIESFTATLEKWFSEWKINGTLNATRNKDYIDFYSREHQALLFAELIKKEVQNKRASQLS